MKYTVTLPNGDCASASTWEGIENAVATLIEDTARHLRENLTVEKDGIFDAEATSMLSQAGLVA